MQAINPMEELIREGIMDSNKLPTELQIVPILEAIIEIRFSTDFPKDTVVGVAFNHFKDRFSEFEELPVYSIPQNDRYTDPVLAYLPYSKMRSMDKKYALQVGQRVFSIHRLHPHYDRFESFHADVVKYINEFSALGVIKNVEEVSIRYIDFFTKTSIPGYSFDQLNIDVRLGSLGVGDFFSCNATYSQTHAKHTIQVYSNVDFTADGKTQNGDIIDIDSTLSSIEGIKFDAIFKAIELAHEEQKKIFFDLIGTKVTTLLKPKY